ncbi:MAG TPA: pitrilysin family protein [Vicinamibacterales bacterium]|nr:pitrilysin family protein [Vicinamibacterales bacterium]
MNSATLAKGLSPTRVVLDNGIVILAQESRGTPAVAVNATFHAGSVDDPPALPGVAYLTRRTIDRGTVQRSATDIADALDDRGVSLRVAVARHTFTISCVCLTEDFSDILALVADIGRHPMFPEEEIDKRRLEAITSVREAQDDPSRVAVDLVHAQLYGASHPYGRPIKGTVGSLEAIGREHLVGFHNRYLVPSALRLAVAGDVSPSTVLACSARVFEGWRGFDRPQEPVAPPPSRTGRSFRAKHMPGKSQADIGYGFTSVRRLDPRYNAYWIMNNVLGQFGLGGRLADNIRERQGMAYYAYSTMESTEAEGPLVIRAGVDPNDVERAIEAIDAEVQALRDGGPTIDELEDTREALIGSIPRMFETNESIAEFLQHAEQFGLGLDYDRRLPALIRAVTMDDVREAARGVLDPGRAAVAVAGPRP